VDIAGLLQLQRLRVLTMVVIYRASDWRLIEAPQDIEAAWALAEALSAKTGVKHCVGKV